MLRYPHPCKGWFVLLNHRCGTLHFYVKILLRDFCAHSQKKKYTNGDVHGVVRFGFHVIKEWFEKLIDQTQPFKLKTKSDQTKPNYLYTVWFCSITI